MLDGSTAWDRWALGAIILESDMQKDEYFNVCQERGSLAKASMHIERPGVCRHIKELIRRTVLVKEDDKIMALDEMMVLLKQASFKRYM